MRPKAEVRALSCTVDTARRVGGDPARLWSVQWAPQAICGGAFCGAVAALMLGIVI